MILNSYRFVGFLYTELYFSTPTMQGEPEGGIRKGQVGSGNVEGGRGNSEVGGRKAEVGREKTGRKEVEMLGG